MFGPPFFVGSSDKFTEDRDTLTWGFDTSLNDCKCYLITELSRPSRC